MLPHFQIITTHISFVPPFPTKLKVSRATSLSFTAWSEAALITLSLASLLSWSTADAAAAAAKEEEEVEATGLRFRCTAAARNSDSSFNSNFTSRDATTSGEEDYSPTVVFSATRHCFIADGIPQGAARLPALR